MKNLFITIDKEILSSKSKFENIDSSTIHGLSQKFGIFSTELQRLDNVLKDIINAFFKSNDLSDLQEKEIKIYTSKAMTNFITKSKVPRINSDFKIDIK